MLSSYRRVLSRPGTLLFSACGLVARLPISMITLGIVLLVTGATGSYGVAASVSAVCLLAEASLAIVQGRLVDRFGQPRVLSLAVTGFAAGLAVMTWSVQASWPMAVTYLAAAVAGGALPAVGSCVRARWAHVLTSARELRTAYALESVLDEVVFMVGPVLVTVLALAWHPVAALAAAILAGTAGTYALAAQSATAPPARGARSRSGDPPPMPWRLVAVLTVVCLALGALFGSAEVATVAFADEREAEAATGALLGLWSLGSLLSGLVTGTLAWRRGPEVLLRRGTLALTLTMLPLTLVESVPLMAVVLFAGGFAIAPTLISTMSLTQQAVPAGRLTEGMSVLHTGIAAGVAPGAAAAGLVVDAYGGSAAYLVPFLAGLVATASAATTRRAVDNAPASSS